MQSLMKSWLSLLALLLGSANALADTPVTQQPARLAIIVDTSRSMVGPTSHSARSTSAQIRAGLASSLEAQTYPIEVDLWQFNGRNNALCTPALVHDGSHQLDGSLVSSIHDLQMLQASNGLAMDQQRNPISASLDFASSTSPAGILLITDRVNDCHRTADRVCALAGELAMPVHVMSFADSNRARDELACIAEASHGTFIHVADGRETLPLIHAMVTLTVNRAQISVAEQLNLELSHHIETLVHNNEQQIKNNEALIAENTNLTDRNRALEQENGLLKEKNEALELRIVELTDERNALREDIIELEKEVARLKQALADETEKVAVLDEHVARLVVERDALRGEVSALKSEVEGLKIDLKACTIQKIDLEKQLSERHKEILDLRQTVILATNNCEARIDMEQALCRVKLEDYTASCDNQIALLNKIIEDQKKQIGTKDVSITALHKAIAERDAIIEGLRTELAAAAEVIAAQKVQIEHLLEVVAGLEAAIGEISIDLLNCQNNRDMARAETDSALIELKQCEAENQELKGYLDHSNALLMSCQGDLGEARIHLKHLSEIKAENELLHKKVSFLSDQYTACLADKASFLSGLTPLVDSHLDGEGVGSVEKTQH